MNVQLELIARLAQQPPETVQEVHTRQTSRVIHVKYVLKVSIVAKGQLKKRFVGLERIVQ